MADETLQLRFAATDEEIAAAVSEWLDARGEDPQRIWPTGIVVRFRYADGTGGSVAWELERRHVEFDSDRALGAWLLYNLRNATHVVGLAFTPEIFRDVAIVPTLHEQALRDLSIAANKIATRET